MLLHDFEFVDVQTGWFFQDNVRYRHLAHVVKHGGHAQDVPLDVDLLLGNAALSRPGFVDLHGVSRDPIDMGGRLLGVPHFRHANHAKKQGAGHLRALQRHRRDAGEVGHHLLVFPGKFDGVAFGIQGVDDLKDAENVSPGGLERKREDRTRDVVGFFVHLPEKPVGLVRLDFVNVGNVQRSARERHVARDAAVVYGNLEVRVYQFFAVRKPLFQGVVLRVRKVQIFPVAYVDGTGVRVGEQPGFGKDLLHEDVQVVHLVEFHAQKRQRFQFVLFVKHSSSFPPYRPRPADRADGGRLSGETFPFPAQGFFDHKPSIISSVPKL